MSAGNKAYLVISAPGAGNSGIDSQPLNVSASGYMVASDNVTASSVGAGVNFSYGDSDFDIKEALVASMRAYYSDPDMEVTFL